ncbi:MAG: zf-HC2 domain-containing protein [Bryobacteraceae bacterium]
MNDTKTNEAIKMGHAEATRIQAPARYLLGELSPSEVEGFEEHYFSCRECGDEIRLQTIFAENARAVFRDRANFAPATLPARSNPGWWERLRTAFALPFAASVATAACLLALVGFQNLVTIPHLKTEVSQLSSGEAPFSFPLKIARGAEAIGIPQDSVFFMPYFYLPGGAAFSHYVCDVQMKAGNRHKRLTVSAPPPGQPLRLMLLRSEFPSGTYTVTVRGDNSPDPIATYSMDLSTN